MQPVPQHTNLWNNDYFIFVPMKEELKEKASKIINPLEEDVCRLYRVLKGSKEAIEDNKYLQSGNVDSLKALADKIDQTLSMGYLVIVYISPTKNKGFWLDFRTNLSPVTDPVHMKGLRNYAGETMKALPHVHERLPFVGKVKLGIQKNSE